MRHRGFFFADEMSKYSKDLEDAFKKGNLDARKKEQYKESVKLALAIATSGLEKVGVRVA